jgi:hypothetical protein
MENHHDRDGLQAWFVDELPSIWFFEFAIPYIISELALHVEGNFVAIEMGKETNRSPRMRAASRLFILGSKPPL